MASGHKVKLSIVYRGREQAHKELGFKLAEKVIDKMSAYAVVDQQPQLAGRQLSFVLRASNQSKHKEVNQGGDNA